MSFFTLKYSDGILTVLDQTKLPCKIDYLNLSTVKQVFEAIRNMNIRGAPAIGICAAFGMCIAARECGGDINKLKSLAEYLCSARPTAVNLSWAITRMLDAAEKPGDIYESFDREAILIMEEDEAMNKKIGENLLTLLPQKAVIMTYCNAGVLAATKYGTALSPIYVGLEQGRTFSVYACETRPRLQGSRLTAFELQQAGVDVTVICDNNAANILRQGNVDAVITGCDRVAANGDAANKVGTFGLSIIAKYFKIPFYIAAPTPTIDFTTKTGNDIIIEYRNEEEVSKRFGVRSVPLGVKILNPAFDVVPAKNITAIVTQKGIFKPSELKCLLEGS